MSIPGSAAPFLLAQQPAAEARYLIQRSLRFNSSDSAFLSRTPSTAGNRKTWTWAGWVKRTRLGALQLLFGSSTFWTELLFTSSDQLQIYWETTGTGSNLLISNAVYRDTAGWMHIVLAVDTTQSTASNRIRVYVNGSEISWASASYPSQNFDLGVNGVYAHGIGSRVAESNLYLGAYVADVHFIDGQALDPTSFGEFSATTGIWQPIEYTGFGDNPNNNTTWSNNWTASGNGFGSQPPSYAFDGNFSTYMNNSNGGQVVTWNTSSYGLSGSLRIYAWSSSGLYDVYVNGTKAADTGSTAAWIDCGTHGTINEIQFAGTTYNTSDGLGLAGILLYAVEVNGYLLLNNSPDNSFHLDFSDNSTAAALGADSSGNGNDWDIYNIQASSSGQVYSSMLSGSVKTATAGFTAPFNVGRSEGTGGLTFTPTTPIPYSSSVEIYDNNNVTRAQVNGGAFVQMVPNSWVTVASGSGTITSIYSVRTDSPSYDAGWQAIRVDGSILYDADLAGVDSLVDVPTNGTETDTGLGNQVRGNYATLNPINSSSTTTLSNGNLNLSSGNNWGSCMSTIGFTGGKFYYETTVTASNYSYIGVSLATHLPTHYPSQNGSWALLNDGNCYYDQLGSGTITVNTGTSVPAGAVVGTAIDADNGKIWWSVNGTWIGSGSPDPATGADAIFSNIPTDEPLVACLDVYGNSASVNFGQRPFAHQAPSGFKTLNTSSLPAPVVTKPSEYMDVVTYQGNGTSQTISGLDLSPGLVWFKQRSGGSLSGDRSHELIDIARGTQKALATQSNGIEYTSTGSLTAFNSDGFDIGSEDRVNENNAQYVAWTWDAGHPSTASTGAVSFDGTGDYLSLADSDDWHFGTGDFTIEAFVYLSSTAVSSTIVSQYGPTYSFLFSINGNQPFFYYYGGTTGYFNGGTVPTSKWTHIALTRSGDVFRIFVDGSQAATTTLASFNFNNVTVPLRIGGDGTYDLDGFISNLRIVKGTALYTSSFTPSTTPLTNVTNTKLLCCQSPTSAGAAAVSPNISGVNDGTVWSDNVTYTGNVYSGANFVFKPEYAFDGVAVNSSNYNTNGMGPFSPGTVTFNFDGSFSGNLKVQGRLHTGDTITVNGSVISNPGDNSYSVFNLGSVSNLTSLSITGSVGNVSFIGQILFDDVVLVNPVVTAGGARATAYNPLDAFSVDGTGYPTASAASITQGTIPLTGASINRSAGFSIVTYNGTGSAATVPHGLGVAPSLLIVKQRNALRGWSVYHKDIGASYYLELERPNAKGGPYSGLWNDTAPTSTVFSILNDGGTNASGGTYVAYCFAPVSGHSVIGSYIGNGSSDGRFVYTGFRPRFVLVKNTTNSSWWQINDTARNTANLTNLALAPNESNREYTYTSAVMDILSNGFKLRGSDNYVNALSNTYIYAAFAESPMALNNRAR